MIRLALLAVALTLIFSASVWAAPEKPAAPTDGFAIYLLENGNIIAEQALHQDLDSLVLQPKPWLTGKDMLDYRWDDHSFRLKDGVKVSVPKPGVLGIPFVVTADGKRMYLGAFWTPISSASFPNPGINVASLPGATNDGRITIERAYPSPDMAGSAIDPRSNPLIREALAKQTNVLMNKPVEDYRYYPDPDAILKTMKKQSDLVLHVRVTKVDGGWSSEAGVIQWTADCEVQKAIKGNQKFGDKIRISFTTFDFNSMEKNVQATEPPLMQKGRDYVVFLTLQPGKRYELLDRWVGALPYNSYLVDRLTKYL